MATFTVGGNSYEVEVVTLGNPVPAGYIPPAGVHPVVQLQGQPVVFLAPCSFDPGITGSLSSGFDIPYSVRVDFSIPDGNRFRISGTIGV